MDFRFRGNDGTLSRDRQLPAISKRRHSKAKELDGSTATRRRRMYFTHERHCAIWLPIFRTDFLVRIHHASYMNDHFKGVLMLKMRGSGEDGMVAGVALGIAVFLALCSGIYLGWSFGLRHFS
jgi:hypothetical protein